MTKRSPNFPDRLFCSGRIFLPWNPAGGHGGPGESQVDIDLLEDLHPFTLSAVTLSPCHPSPFHPFTLSPFTPSPWNLFTLPRFILSPFHLVTPSPFHPFTFSPFHPFTFSPLHPFTPSPQHSTSLELSRLRPLHPWEYCSSDDNRWSKLSSHHISIFQFFTLSPFHFLFFFTGEG